MGRKLENMFFFKLDNDLLSTTIVKNKSGNGYEGGQM